MAARSFLPARRMASRITTAPPLSSTAPVATDAYACTSKPLPLNTFTTDCRPVPAAPQVVLRAKG